MVAVTTSAETARGEIFNDFAYQKVVDQVERYDSNAAGQFLRAQLVLGRERAGGSLIADGPRSERKFYKRRKARP